MHIKNKTIYQKIKKIFYSLSIVFILFTFVLITSFFHIGCLVKDVIGLPCPGCGLTRATLAFLRLDFKTAFHYHPLFWLATPVLIVSIYGKKPLFNSKKIEIIIYVTVGIAFIVVYIYRMLILFPTIEPMTINNNSFLLIAFRIIKSFISQHISLVTIPN
ncbi:MAG TPA: DUF2752 domain-containing protein [Clostridiaceae bacterium]